MPPARLKSGFFSIATAAAAAMCTLSISAVASGQGYICAEGGGNPGNGDWAPSVFGWMVEKAGHADVVILGLSGSDAAATAAFNAAGANSVTNLAVNATNADTPSVYDQITAADIVWIRGGNQWNYVNLWGGTLTEQAIRDVFDAGGVVGGSSAGCAIMGSIIYDSQFGSLSPRQALQNPYHPFLTFTTDFLELTPGVLFDTHFTERGRLGRLIVQLGRYAGDTGEDILAVGVDDRTALCIHPDGTAEVRGEAAVTFLHLTEESQLEIEPNQTPVITHVRHTQLTEGYTYDLNSRQVIARPDHAVLTGPSTITPDFNTTSLNGSLMSERLKGEYWVDDGGSAFALFDGALDILPGQNRLQGAIISTNVWASNNFAENRTGGPQYAIKEHPHRMALFLDTGVQLQAREPAFLDVKPATTTLESAFLLLDAHEMISTAQSTYWSSNNFSVGPRQSVAIENAMLHALRSGMSYNALSHDLAVTGDLTGDGVVNVFDLLMLLDQWGACSHPDLCPADLTEDGQVNVFDLLLLLDNWGS